MLLSDGESYLPGMTAAMEAARHLILLVGWDFDPRITLGPSALGGEKQERWNSNEGDRHGATWTWRLLCETTPTSMDFLAGGFVESAHRGRAYGSHVRR